FSACACDRTVTWLGRTAEGDGYAQEAYPTQATYLDTHTPYPFYTNRRREKNKRHRLTQIIIASWPGGPPAAPVHGLYRRKPERQSKRDKPSPPSARRRFRKDNPDRNTGPQRRFERQAIH